MNVASIDIGTNTILLLIAEVNPSMGTLKTIRNEYEMPRLGKGLLPGKPIGDAQLAKFYAILKKYRAIIDDHNCAEIIVTATNAMRIASNADEIISNIKDQFGFDIKVVPGNEEAYLSYLGASSLLPEINDKVVIDVGGGSTEIIYGIGNEIFYKNSFKFGAVSLTEKHFKNDPPLPAEIQNLSDDVISNFSQLVEIIPPEFSLIGVAGTPTTLSCMELNLKEYDSGLIEGSILTLESFKKLIDRLSKMTSKKILETFGQVVTGREDVLLAGSLILYNFMGITGIDKMHISGKGIRYGAVINYMNQLNQNGKTGK